MHRPGRLLPVPSAAGVLRRLAGGGQRQRGRRRHQEEAKGEPRRASWATCRPRLQLRCTAAHEHCRAQTRTTARTRRHGGTVTRWHGDMETQPQICEHTYARTHTHTHTRAHTHAHLLPPSRVQMAVPVPWHLTPPRRGSLCVAGGQAGRFGRRAHTTWDRLAPAGAGKDREEVHAPLARPMHTRSTHATAHTYQHAQRAYSSAHHAHSTAHTHTHTHTLRTRSMHPAACGTAADYQAWFPFARVCVCASVSVCVRARWLVCAPAAATPTPSLANKSPDPHHPQLRFVVSRDIEVEAPTPRADVSNPNDFTDGYIETRGERASGEAGEAKSRPLIPYATLPSFQPALLPTALRAPSMSCVALWRRGSFSTCLCVAVPTASCSRACRGLGRRAVALF